MVEFNKLPGANSFMFFRGNCCCCCCCEGEDEEEGCGAGEEATEVQKEGLEGLGLLLKSLNKD